MYLLYKIFSSQMLVKSHLYHIDSRSSDGPAHILGQFVCSTASTASTATTPWPGCCLPVVGATGSRFLCVLVALLHGTHGPWFRTGRPAASSAQAAELHHFLALALSSAYMRAPARAGGVAVEAQQK